MTFYPTKSTNFVCLIVNDMDSATIKQEKQEILRQYRHLIEVWTTRKETKDLWDVRRAFRMAADAHKDDRRKSGEPYIYHPLAVATIAAGEMGLGRTSIIAALLHDTVEDTEITLEDVENMFGKKVARIIDGLTKIDKISEKNSTAQSATLKKIILTLSDDVRVILVKLADRLHNMRTLEFMPREKQLRIASETLFIYAPLAYRLGFFAMKSELEELSFKYSQPDIYEEIKNKMDQVKQEREQYLHHFMQPIKQTLQKQSIQFELVINVKTTYSVWKKMQRTELPFEQIYNTFSLDVIIDTSVENESLQCWAVYAAIAKIYKPNNKKLRDWMSTPKANGYEAIHTTVMGQNGRWVDVHIRSRRMQEIAQKGYAAYLKYKKNPQEEGTLDVWLNKTRELLLMDDDEEAIHFIDVFKQNLFAEEIYVFTPKGDLYTLPYGATVLDFAYAIHSDLGNHAIGANLNRRLVSIDHQLRSGDQVEIITSRIQEPTEEWFKNVVTARAKTGIKNAIKNKRKAYTDRGKEKLKEIFKQLNIDYHSQNIHKLVVASHLTSLIDFYYFIATDKITPQDIKEILKPEEKSSWFRNLHLPFIYKTNKTPKEENKTIPSNKEKPLKINELDYVVSKCCNPIPGDDVLALQIPGEPTQVHRTDCNKAIQLMSVYGRNIVKDKWKQAEGITYLAILKIDAKDKIGLVNQVTDLISLKHHLNMSSINIESKEGLAHMEIKLYVEDTNTLKKLISDLRKIKEVIKVSRVNRT